MPQNLKECPVGMKCCVLSILLTTFVFGKLFSQNAIVTENQNPGVPQSTWDITNNFDGTYGDLSIQGFATDISVNKGGTINFKIDVNTGTDKNFDITIYRIGYYQGNGARTIVDLGNFTGIAQNACNYDGTTGLTDCGNWTTTASWAVPSTAVSGLYVAKLTRSAAGGGGNSHIAFVVRDDASTSQICFKTSDATWQAYNIYGGNSLYEGPGLPNAHASKVSFNRPFLTRNGGGGGNTTEDWFMIAEYPMIRFMEANGFDMSYTTDIDVARNGGLLLNHKAILSVGHDEYWSKEERTSVEAVKSAGLNLAFFSGNEIYWKTRWENSIDGTNTAWRTMVCYKDGGGSTPAEVGCPGKCDPTPEWTGLWRTGCNQPNGNACQPENGLSGEISWDGTAGTIQVPDTFKNIRFWRNTPVAAMTTGQTLSLATGTLGYEWDWEQYLTNYPPGRFTLSSTFLDGKQHKASLYKSTAGGWVFGAGTIQWAWGLDANHDRAGSAVDPSMRQGTINLFADMGIQPATLQSGLVAATASTDVTPPVSVITSPSNGATFHQGDTVIIKGTASDVGGVVAGVEISVDGGVTWQEVTSGTTSWTYTWVPAVQGSVTIKTRAVDDSGNLEVPGGSEGAANMINVSIGPPLPPTNCPCSIFTPSQTPAGGETPLNDGFPIALGVRFKSQFDGFINSIKFYKGVGDTTHNTVQLWIYNTTSPVLIGTAQITNNATATSTGWVEVPFLNPVAITANTIYVASYYSSTGVYSSTNFAYQDSIVNGPLTGVIDTSGNPGGLAFPPNNGLYSYGPPAPPEFPATPLLPSNSYESANYWVDVSFVPGADTASPKIVSTSPSAGATSININAFVSATFTKDVDSNTVNNSTFILTDASNNTVPATVTYSLSTRTAGLTPNSPLAYSTTYTATLVGGTTDPVIRDTSGKAMLQNYVWTFTTAPTPAAPPDDGSGGPVLIISSAANPFSRYPVEILRAQGYNAFEAKDLSELTTNVLDSFDVVILGEVATSGLPSSDLTILSNWVNAGGTLIALRPDITNTGLMNLLGINQTGAVLSDEYLLVNTNTGMPGAGIVNQTIQFHGTADKYTLGTATPLAMLYSSASTATTFPAITTNSVGVNGGKAIAFAYDLAKSVVYTRQGNPQWAGQSRDGQSGPTRSDNLFFPNYVDFNKIQIPQADEQQHLLTNIILLSDLHIKPLPHLWFLPNGYKATVVMTGDDHATGNTAGRFDEYMTLGPNDAQSIADWKAIRGTSYMYANTPVSNDSVNYFQNQGFELALHPSTFCENFDEASLNTDFVTQISEIQNNMPSIAPLVSNRTHCLPWSDWSTQPKIENSLGIRFDVNYYYWPASWIQNRPGMFTGSGMPMRFADLDGSIIDCYQSPTQITDESGQDIPYNIATLLDNAINLGYYGVFTMNMHTDTAIHIGSNEIIAAAQARNIPVVSAKQMLTWIDSRNNTVFGPMKWQNNQLSFTITTTAHNLQTMVPMNSATGSLIQVTENGVNLNYTAQTVKGIAYGVFPVSTNSYVAIYSSTPLPILLTSFTATKEGDDAQLDWTTSMEQNNSGFEVQRSTDASTWKVLGFVQGAINSQTPKSYQYIDRSLPAGTYYYRLRQVDLDGNSQFSKVQHVTFSGDLSLELMQNRPNPFNSSTTVDIVIPKAGRVQLIMYDQMGRPMQQLMDEEKAPGTYSIIVNRNGLSSGIYYYKMQALGQSIVRKMTIL